MRLAGDAARRGLKRATADLVQALGGIEGAAASLEKGKSVVGRWTCRNEPAHFIGVGDLADLEALAARPFVTEYLCKLNGGIFVPHIEHGADPGTLGFLVMRLSKELGDLSGEVATALADGAMDQAEAKRALAELDQLVVAAAQVRAALQQKMGAA
jgi:hypothetical protein